MHGESQGSENYRNPSFGKIGNLKKLSIESTSNKKIPRKFN